MGVVAAGAWSWQHPDVESMLTRRRRFLGVVVLIVLLMMAYRGYQSYRADLLEQLVSVVVVPGFIGILLVVAERAPTQRAITFRMWVTPDGVLHAGTPRNTSSVSLSAARELTITHRTTVRHTTRGRRRHDNWCLHVHPAVGEPVDILLPGYGFPSRLLTDQEVELLEQQLRSLAGLPNVPGETTGQS